MKLINSQFTDGPIQGVALTVDQAGSLSMAYTFMTAANSIGLIMQNSVSVQQGTQQIAQAAVAKTCALIVANAGTN